MLNKSKILIITWLIFLTFSCKLSTKTTIGLLLPNLTQDRYAKDRDFFTQKANSLGLTVTTSIANDDPKLQEEQAISLIDNGANVLVITAVNQTLAASIVRYAHKKDVKIIAYERLISNCELDYFISFDHFDVGKLQASYAINKTPIGNYVIIGGDKRDKNAELIFNGQMSIIKPLIDKGQINIIYSGFTEDWSNEAAQQQMIEIVTLNTAKIDVVLAANDGISQAVQTVLATYQPEYKCITTGLDADKQTLEYIKQGRQTMTVAKSFKIQAEEAAELANQIVSNSNIDNIAQTTFNGTSNVPTILLKAEIVDIQNVEKYK